MSFNQRSPVEQGSLEDNVVAEYLHDDFEFFRDEPTTPDPTLDTTAQFSCDWPPFSDPTVDTTSPPELPSSTLIPGPQPTTTIDVSPATFPGYFSEFVRDEPFCPDPNLDTMSPPNFTSSGPIPEPVPAATTEVSPTTVFDSFARPSSSGSSKYLNPTMLMTAQNQQVSLANDEWGDMDVNTFFNVNDEEPTVNDAQITMVPSEDNDDEPVFNALTGQLPNPFYTNAPVANLQGENMDVDYSVWMENQLDLYCTPQSEPSQPGPQLAPSRSYDLHNPYSNHPQAEPSVFPMNQQITCSGDVPVQAHPYTEFADAQTDYLPQNGAYSYQQPTGFGDTMQLQQGWESPYHISGDPAPQAQAGSWHPTFAELAYIAQVVAGQQVHPDPTFPMANAYLVHVMAGQQPDLIPSFPVPNAPNNGFNQSQRLPMPGPNLVSSEMPAVPQGHSTSSVMPINQLYAQPDDGAEDLAMSPTIPEGPESLDEPSTPLSPGPRRVHIDPTDLRERPQHDPDRPWIRINASSSGMNARSGKINNWHSKKVYTDFCEHPFGDWSSRNHRFRYDGQGELAEASMTADKISEFLFDHPQGQGRKLVLWIQKTPDGCARRYENYTSNKCRFKECPNRLSGYERTIKVGNWRVCFDEYWHTHGRKHDPLVAAGYVHLYCLERFLNFPDICAKLDVRADDRVLPLEFDGKWKASLTSEPGALSVAQRFIDACKNGKYETEEVPTYFAYRDYKNASRATFEGTLCCAMTRKKLQAESPTKVKQYEERVKGKGPCSSHWQVNLGDLAMYIEGREGNNARLNPGLSRPRRRRIQQGTSHERSESQEVQASEGSSRELRARASESSSRRSRRARTRPAISYAEKDSDSDADADADEDDALFVPESRKRKRRLIEEVEEEEEEEVGDVIEVRPTTRPRRHYR